MKLFKDPPKKNLGQHFLVDRDIIDKIVMALKPAPEDFIVEIGPGQGAITFPILKKHGSLTVIEFDRDLITPLMESAEGIGELTIIHKDVLKVDFTKLAADRPAIRLVGNLPYNISTPILFHVLEHAPAVRDMHFMLQKEVIDRMAAEPGSKVYGRLTVMLQARCEVTPLFMVPPHAFRPPPKVDSAVVRLVPLASDKILIQDPVLFENLVRDAFGQRRKTIRNAMQALCTAEDIEAVGLRPDARAEQLPVADFIKLANFLASKSSATT
ncbi:MAG TPA: 16S rRNA (adenine(1518)-N(6)/adenine(1519)-N(6))-dimethyltransferase RsmA [Arenimonas sp.]|nr:16S rRNA (adenine(1518)-N(6)/adenine(1519)-N(6))-dimethyltransferase RsmA [Arenimonas sp.]HOZ05369.1 16S rRNA (adenine(1518)-N(6)/adenine(1519)-N(6))-dimethyltransferase RsmA [Arenimonas sp.]HPO25118.1 16S rRNA (adenine(1518)-N(6)/adenine(1519)-N(6))-dimethyltransferase RsmA [Arenimonas sp.]HPW31500.1 16S rRNA (adenine(1518)-N(6)/adenine(1519)-N(6))-dimethyltransferase RsmA [Arenimonas sp.]